MKETTENNILLAEFVNFWEAEEGFLYSNHFEKGFAPDDLKFHSDWNWLMLVVNKIGEMENFLYPDGMYSYLVQFKIEVGNGCVQINDFYGEGLINIKHYEDSLIENLYNACIQFVKWYNENK